MARIAYPDPAHYGHADLVARIQQERGGKLLNLYKMLLHSPPLAEGWLGFLTAVRQKTDLPDRYRELVILRIAVLNGAEYEFKAHVPFALAAGIDAATIEALRANVLPPGLGPRERAVLAYADAMTVQVRVADEVFDDVRGHFEERQLVELTATIAAYNCVSRFLEALRVDRE
jgi:alkylhydroperoxidase family enzyme